MATSVSLARPVSAEVKRKSLALIQVPNNSHHKGSSGRVVVMGGSRDYTGAPYFAAMSAMRSGVDMGTIVTTRSAAIPLKSLSPDLIVRGIIPSRAPPSPPLPSSSSSSVTPLGNNAYDELSLRHIREIQELLSKSHALIIGPGMASVGSTEYCTNNPSTTTHPMGGKAADHSGKNDETCQSEKEVTRHQHEYVASVDMLFDSSGPLFGDEMCPLFVEWLRSFVSDGCYSSPLTSAFTDHRNVSVSQAKASSDSSSFLAASRTVPCVIDATGLAVLADALACRSKLFDVGLSSAPRSSDAKRNRSFPPIILTPNVNEIKILYKAALLRGAETDTHVPANHPEQMAVVVSKQMHCCVLLKGYEDFVAIEGEAVGRVTMQLPHRRKGKAEDEESNCELTPCARRVAGQGDILSGLAGAFLAWQDIRMKKAVACSARANEEEEDRDASIAAVGASLAMKHCCVKTAASAGTTRFLVSDILKHVSESIDELASSCVER